MITDIYKIWNNFPFFHIFQSLLSCKTRFQSTLGCFYIKTEPILDCIHFFMQILKPHVNNLLISLYIACVYRQTDRVQILKYTLCSLLSISCNDVKIATLEPSK